MLINLRNLLLTSLIDCNRLEILVEEENKDLFIVDAEQNQLIYPLDGELLD